MKITEGKTVVMYAEKYDIAIVDVLDWINTYINNPPPEMRVEPTEKERAASIMEYVKGEAAQ